MEVFFGSIPLISNSGTNSSSTSIANINAYSPSMFVQLAHRITLGAGFAMNANYYQTVLTAPTGLLALGVGSLLLLNISYIFRCCCQCCRCFTAGKDINGYEEFDDKKKGRY